MKTLDQLTLPWMPWLPDDPELGWFIGFALVGLGGFILVWSLWPTKKKTRLGSVAAALGLLLAFPGKVLAASLIGVVLALVVMSVGLTTILQSCRHARVLEDPENRWNTRFDNVMLSTEDGLWADNYKVEITGWYSYWEDDRNSARPAPVTTNTLALWLTNGLVCLAPTNLTFNLVEQELTYEMLTTQTGNLPALEGIRVELERSVNLVDWEYVAPMTVGNQPIIYIDTAAPTERCFYRTAMP